MPKALCPPAPEPPVVWEPDGTPRSPRFGDIYRNRGVDGHGGLAQCHHVFLKGCGLLGEQALWQGHRHWTILETGFGLGLNFLATWAAWRGDPLRPRHLHFVSVEAYPVSAEDLLKSVAPWPALRPLAEQLSRQWWGLTEGLHRLRFDDGRVLLNLFIGPAQRRLPEMHVTADSVFLDGFSPDLNPELWSHETLSLVASHCRHGTRLATWSVTRVVRDNLGQLGFDVQKVAGLAPKRHALTATYSRPGSDSTAFPNQSPGRCAVIGAGLAGAACARALAERGWHVEVIESGATTAAGASGLPAGLCAPHVSPDDSDLSRLSRAGVRATWERVTQLLRDREDYALTGVLERRLPGKARKAGLPADWPLDGERWSRYASERERQLAWGDETHSDEGRALWHTSGFWLRPSRLVEELLNNPRIDVKLKANVSRLVRDPAGQAWSLELATGEVLNAFGQVILCAGPATPTLLATVLPEARIPPFTPVRGQLSWGWIDPAIQDALPPFPVNGNGSFLGGIPLSGRLAWLCGSGFDRQRQAADIDSADHLENLERLRPLLPPVAERIQPLFESGDVRAWAGVRCTTPDRLPRVGEIAPQIAPGLHLLTGLGARGLTLGILCAELLAARVSNEPLPLESRLARRLDAQRGLPA